ncbi:hypothetical protein [Actimicrobium antarcticum]|uniref:Bacterial Ig-like domain-containing protein n=1 Tax=Actimicrobium antarcticum TaxID=1051899 RepID=A0ABP7TXG7_9BURK
MQIHTPFNCFMLMLGLASIHPAAMSVTPQKPIAPIATPATPVIDQFTVKPGNKTDLGTELKFSLFGTPRGKATVSIDDAIKELALQEIQPGVYEGTYTLRAMENTSGSISAIAMLESGGTTAQARLTQAPINESKPLIAKNISPRDGETVVTNPVLISATFDDVGGIAIDTKTVRILLAGEDVSRNSAVTPQFFSYRSELQPGNYVVDVSAKDVAGRSMRQTWSFNVAAVAVPVTTVLPMQITSHSNNAQVGAEPIEIRGHTAADTRLEVQVQAVAAIAGFFSLSQKVFTQTLTSDAKGNFVFVFQPKVTVAGTRYEVTINASKADLTKEFKLNLFQQK